MKSQRAGCFTINYATEPVNTWARWKELGFEVIHGSKALFSTALIWGSRGDGATYKASFFGESQVQPI